MAAFKGLEDKLEEGMAFLGKAPAPLLLALAHLSSATPGKIVTGMRGQVLQWLLPAVCGLIDSPLEDASALLGILQILQETLAESAGKLKTGGSVSSKIDGYKLQKAELPRNLMLDFATQKSISRCPESRRALLAEDALGLGPSTSRTSMLA